MSHQRVIATTAAKLPADAELLARVQDQLGEAAAAANACADACTAEGNVEQLGRCITLDLDTADIVAATAKVTSRFVGFPTDVVRSQLEACCSALEACAAECEQHTEMHEHCAACAQACRDADEALHELLGATA